MPLNVMLEEVESVLVVYRSAGRGFLPVQISSLRSDQGRVYSAVVGGAKIPVHHYLEAELANLSVGTGSPEMVALRDFLLTVDRSQGHGLIGFEYWPDRGERVRVEVHRTTTLHYLLPKA